MANANMKRIPWKSLQIEKELSVHTLDVRCTCSATIFTFLGYRGTIGSIYIYICVYIGKAKTDKMTDKSFGNTGEVFTEEGRKKYFVALKFSTEHFDVLGKIAVR